jgi:hypothetical protein
VAGDVDVEALQLLAELGHVLLGGALGRRQLALDLGSLGLLALPCVAAADQHGAATDDAQHNQENKPLHAHQSAPLSATSTPGEPKKH